MARQVDILRRPKTGHMEEQPANRKSADVTERPSIPEGGATNLSKIDCQSAQLRTPRLRKLIPLGAVERNLGPKYLATACIPSTYCVSRKRPHTSEITDEQTVTDNTSLRPDTTGTAQTQEEPPIHVVEALATLSITTGDESTELVSPRSWLVLESPLAQEEERNSDAHLSVSAGGGRVPAKLTKLLRPVDNNRLHTAAAEANFQRVSNKRSIVALHHAAIASGIVGQHLQEASTKLPVAAREATVIQHYEGLNFSLPTGAGVAVIKTDARGTHVLTEEGLRRIVPSSCLRMNVPPTWCTNQKEAMARARRLEPLVSANAATASLRADLAQLSKSLGQRHAEQDEPRASIDRATLFGKTKRKPQHGSSGGVGKSIMKRGYDALMEFKRFTKHKIGNPVRTWFHLDPEENMKIGEKQFLRRCDEMGFHGNVPCLWRYLDADHTGSVSLLEFDTRSAIILADFQQLVVSQFGKTAAAFDFLDGNKSGRISRPEFVAQIRRLGYQGNAARLHDLLDRTKMGMVHTEDLLFLDKWKPVPYLYAEANHRGLQCFKDAMLFQCNSLLKAWIKFLDKDGGMRISWDEFLDACKEIPLAREPLPAQIAAGFPQTDLEIAGCWRAMDDDCSGWIALREFDEESFDALSGFKRWAQRAHGGAVQAFRNLDSSSAKLTKADLRRAVKGEDGYKGDLGLLFDGLDVNNTNSLTENDVRFIDHWDLDWEDWEHQA